MYPKELVKLLKNNGWREVSQSGSHLKMRKRKPDGNYPYAQQRYTERYSSSHFKANGAKTLVPIALFSEYINTKDNIIEGREFYE